jgi:hypothetical protein
MTSQESKQITFPENNKMSADIPIGSVIKIDSTGKEAEEGLSNISEYHNHWATIIKIRKGKKHTILEVVPERENKSIQMVDDNIKRVIGNMKNDWVGIGKLRHSNEVVPEIQRVAKKFGIKL